MVFELLVGPGRGNAPRVWQRVWECQNLHIPDSRKQPLTSRTNKLTGLSKGVPLTDHLLIISSNTHMCGSPGQPAFILKRAATLQERSEALTGELPEGGVGLGADGHGGGPEGGSGGNADLGDRLAEALQLLAGV